VSIEAHFFGGPLEGTCRALRDDEAGTHLYLTGIEAPAAQAKAAAVSNGPQALATVCHVYAWSEENGYGPWRDGRAAYVYLGLRKGER
jgi:hypothetical protein